MLSLSKHDSEEAFVMLSLSKHDMEGILMLSHPEFVEGRSMTVRKCTALRAVNTSSFDKLRMTGRMTIRKRTALRA